MATLLPSIFGGGPIPSRAFETTTVQADQKQAVPIDEWGRPLTRDREPFIGRLFNSRVEDRWSRVNPPWSPDQIANALKAAEMGDLSQQAELFEHMEERDGRLHGYLNARRQKPAGLRWSCEPSDPDDDEAVEIAKFVERELRSIPNFAHALRDMFDAIGKGISALSINWQRGGHGPESRFRIDSIDWINTKRLRFDWKTERLLILPDSAIGNVPAGLGFDDMIGGSYGGIVPLAWTTLVHRSRTRTTHPGKGGVLRIVPYHFMFKNRSTKDVVIFAERHGMPFRYARYGPNAGEEEKSELFMMMEKFGFDGVGIFSKDVEVQLVETKNIGAATGLPFPVVIDLCNKEYEFAILGQEQTNTENGNGSRAKTESGGAVVVQDILESDCVDGHGTLRPQVCYPIVGFSKYGWDKAAKKTPHFRFHYEPEGDYESYAKVDEVVHLKLGLPTTAGALSKRYGHALPEGIDPATVMVYTSEVPPGLEGKPIIHVAHKPAGVVGTLDAIATNDDDLAARHLLPVPLLAARGTTATRFTRAGDTTVQEPVDELIARTALIAATAFSHLDAAVQRLVTDVDAMSVSEEEKFRIVEERLAEIYDDVDTETMQRLVRRTTGTVHLFGRTKVRRPEKED